MPAELISLAQASKQMGVSVQTLRREIRDGRLACYLIRKRYYFTRAHLDAWLKRIERNDNGQ